MDEALFARVSGILDRLLDLPAAERPAVLDRLCAGEPALRSGVEALLAADAGEGPLDRPPQAALGGGPAAGFQIGSWRTVSELGHGGMGTVYLVERCDGQFAQRAALKRIRRGIDSGEVRDRFLAERQILARLEHPGIARLLDGGVGGDGCPYLVLEHVAGVPITTYCQEHELAPDARVALFEQVCQAVEYAHRNLVVHRDLKPSNILVSSRGEVKLLDFGVAKLLDAEGGEPGLTRAGAAPMTLEYAAPEQVRGEPVTTATDVYGLGAVLYELLAGRQPFTAAGRPRPELERDVLERDPERPSAAVASGARAPSGRLSRRLAGDLDTIVLRALRKEPERRYPSVSALREDLRRHLQGLPLRAHPDSLSYRARKFLGRNKLKVGLAAFSALTLVAGLGSTVWQMRAARGQAARAEAVKDFLVRLFEVSDPDVSKGKEIPARVLLDQGAARIERELAGQPALEAEMLGLMGDLYRKLGDYERAGSLLERELALQRRLHRHGADEVAVSLLRLAGLWQDMGELEAAEPLLREALRLARTLHGERSVETARARSALARLLSARGDFASASPLFEQALETLAVTAGRDSADFAETLEAKAQMLLYQGAPEASAPLLEQGLQIRRRLFGDAHTKVIQTLNNLAAARQEMGEHAAAADIFQEVLALDRRLHGSEHPSMALHLTSLGAILNRLGRHSEAEQRLRQALAMRQRFLGADNPLLAVNYNNLGIAVARQGRFAEAEALLRRAASLNRQLVGEDHPQQASVLAMLASVLAEQGKSAEAEDLYLASLAGLRAGGRATESRLADALAGLGGLRLGAHRAAAAEPALAEALEIQRRLYGAADPRTRATAERRAACRRAL